MKTKIGIINLQSGNLFSVAQAFNAIGTDSFISSEPKQLANASHLVLPGVGTFSNFVDSLNKASCVDVIQSHIATGKPILGICVGMQVFMERGYENGVSPGLGLFKGECVKIEGTEKLPSIGWRTIELTGAQSSASLIDKDETPFNRTFYHVHSFCVKLERKQDEVAHYNIGTTRISSYISNENVFGVQFHPERSGSAGLRFLENFSKV